MLIEGVIEYLLNYCVLFLNQLGLQIKVALCLSDGGIEDARNVVGFLCFERFHH